MATKSRVRKKNGKPVKYTAKPKGISKTKMKKLLEMIQEQQKNMTNGPELIPEIREGEGQLLISSDFMKKLNVNSTDYIDKGPELSNENSDIDNKIDDVSEGIGDSVNIEGPSTSDL